MLWGAAPTNGMHAPALAQALALGPTLALLGPGLSRPSRTMDPALALAPALVYEQDGVNLASNSGTT